MQFEYSNVTDKYFQSQKKPNMLFYKTWQYTAFQIFEKNLEEKTESSVSRKKK